MRMRGLRRSGEGGVGAEVFPWLELFTVVGMLVGAALAGGPAWWTGLDVDAVTIRALSGAVAVGLLGVFLGLGLPVVPPPIDADDPSTPPADLWDPWVDVAQGLEPAPL